jgi:hypothetical protein
MKKTGEITVVEVDHVPSSGDSTEFNQQNDRKRRRTVSSSSQVSNKFFASLKLNVADRTLGWFRQCILKRMDLAFDELQMDAKLCIYLRGVLLSEENDNMALEDVGVVIGSELQVRLDFLPKSQNSVESSRLATRKKHSEESEFETGFSGSNLHRAVMELMKSQQSHVIGRSIEDYLYVNLFNFWNFKHYYNSPPYALQETCATLFTDGNEIPFCRTRIDDSVVRLVSKVISFALVYPSKKDFQDEMKRKRLRRAILPVLIQACNLSD